MNPNLLCPGCMRECKKPGTPCAHCGFTDSQYKKARDCRAIPPYTILAGRYLIGRTIGEGGFGITYLAMDLKAEQTVAVKEYFPAGLATRDTTDGNLNLSCITGAEKKRYYKHGLDGFAEEAKNMMKFRDLPGVVSVRDFFCQNQTAYLVMEYIDGITLKQYLKKRNKPVSEKNVLNVMRPLLYSLAKIHSAGIIHRDISPENIMLARDGRVILIDFGAARAATGAETQTLTIILKRGYAPVEQYQSKGRQGPWTDVYALCATMYVMLSGITPDEALERMNNDTTKQLKNLKYTNPMIQVSSAVSDIIATGMSVRAQNRYQNARQLLNALYPEKSNTSANKDNAETPGDSITVEKMSTSRAKTSTEEKAFLIIFLILGVLTALGLTIYLAEQLFALL